MILKPCLPLFICVLSLPIFAEVGNTPDLKILDRKTRESSKKPAGAEPANTESIGQDMKQFGERIAQKVDTVITKRGFEMFGDPWTFQGIPLLFPSDSTGFNLGAKIQFQNIAREDPHKLEVEAQVLTSDRGRQKDSFKLDYPHAFNSRFRFTTRIAYDKDITQRYFGIGNDIKIDDAALDWNNPLYNNTRAGPNFTLSVLHYFNEELRIGPVFGLRWMNITAPTGSLLAAQRPVGVDGGRTHFVGLAIDYQTLDFEPYPTKGTDHELYVQYYSPMVGSSYTFWRSTYTYRRFIPLHRELTFAHRTLFEVLSGDVPYYELSAVGGSSPTIGLGGDKYFRGYESNRFTDKIRLIFGIELRWDPVMFEFAHQQIWLGLVPFLDIGRVWANLTPLDLGAWHPSAGSGFRMIWNRRFVIRFDVALTPDGNKMILNLNNSF